MGIGLISKHYCYIGTVWLNCSFSGWFLMCIDMLFLCYACNICAVFYSSAYLQLITLCKTDVLKQPEISLMNEMKWNEILLLHCTVASWLWITYLTYLKYPVGGDIPLLLTCPLSWEKSRFLEYTCDYFFICLFALIKA